MKNTIGKNIRRYRQLADMTPKRLSELLNITPDELKMYENGKITPDGEMLREISDALRTTPDQLVGYWGTDKIHYRIVDEAADQRDVYLLSNGDWKVTDVHITENGCAKVTFIKKEEEE